MFTSKRLGDYAVTPKTAEGQVVLASLTGEEGLKAAKVLTSMFAVAEVDYCKLLDKPQNSGDLRNALEALALAVNTGDPSVITQAYREFDGALDAACNPIREKYGVSTRYNFNVISRSWARRESVKREVAVGQAAEPTTKLYHKFAGNDGFTAENTNGGKLYEAVHLHYEPKVKATHQTDFKGTALPYFSKHGKYTTEVK